MSTISRLIIIGVLFIAFGIGCIATDRMVKGWVTTNAESYKLHSE